MKDTEIQVILAQADLLSLAEDAGAVFKVKGPARWRSHCPLHNGNNPSGFAISQGDDGKMRWTCYSGDCGSGDAIDFVMKWRGIDFIEACQFLSGEDIGMNMEAVLKLAAERKRKAEQEYLAAQARLEKAIADLETAKIWEQYHTNLKAMPEHRRLWQMRGVPNAWQDIWKLGYSPEFTIWEEDKGSWKPAWKSPTLSIPVFQPGWKIATIRHRLLKPKDPDDKYRPDRSHLGAHPFVANPEMGFKGPVLVVEGEVKAMVSYITADMPGLQVIGIPGKRQFINFAGMLTEADPVYILPDPDGMGYGIRMAEILGLEHCRMIRLPVKIDDAVVNGVLDRRDFRRLLQFAPKMQGSSYAG